MFTATAAQSLGTRYASPVSLSFLTSVGVWGISLLFLIAGAGAYFALERHSPRQFIGKRCLRLLTPFVFASLTLIPLQDYTILRTFPGALGQVAVLGWDRHTADSLVAFYLLLSSHGRMAHLWCPWSYGLPRLASGVAALSPQRKPFH